MKILHLIFLMLLTGFTGSIQAQTKAQIKAEKAEKTELEFQQTLKLVESKHFKVKINKVYPTGGFDVSRFNPEGHINISDSTAEGRLPFFGRAYSAPYGEGGGIEFDALMQDFTMKVNTKKKNNKIIICRFSVRGKNDTFQIQLEITSNEACSVDINSNNRVHISYSGEILPPLEGKK